MKLPKKQAKGEDLTLEIARTEKARRAIKTAFYQRVGVEEQMVAPFRSVDTEGRRWSEKGAQAVVNRMIDVLAKMSDAAGMKPMVDAAYGHVLSSSPGHVTHHRLREDVPVELREGTTWTREQVLDVLEQARRAGQKTQEGACAADVEEERIGPSAGAGGAEAERGEAGGGPAVGDEPVRAAGRARRSRRAVVGGAAGRAGGGQSASAGGLKADETGGRSQGTLPQTLP